MAELEPFPFGRLVARMLRELHDKEAAFDLPTRAFYKGRDGKDLSVRFHGRKAGTPLGPAAGPHSQMAQNLVLAWLGGSRILELKTVQILDELDIPRPCIDMHNVGYNVEWSQELKLEQSLAEYVKGAMLIRILQEIVPMPAHARDTIFDMSVGYDLKGIKSERVDAFLSGMRDCAPLVDAFRKEIPEEWKKLRDLDFRTDLSDTLTLSTFHGCPPDEIEKIIEYLLEEKKLNCVVKLNPTLLGPKELRRIMREVLGYDESIHTPDSAFANDTKWDQAVAFAGRLQEKAKGLGLGFGVKFSNTMLVENHRDFFPREAKEMYLSGPPLHATAVTEVRDWRAVFPDMPISFSAGIDRVNFPDVVGLGCVPVTVCSDLLRPGGYARQKSYFDELEKRMDAVGAANIADFVAKSQDAAGYVEQVYQDPRYGQEKNRAVPKKIGSKLVLFNCVTCDKCVPVCPNDANFTYDLPKLEIPVTKFTKKGTEWVKTTGESLVFDKKHQLANFADFCNECGNCDVFCPEDGGPYVEKPRFFGTLKSFKTYKDHDGFFIEKADGVETIYGRFTGKDFRLSVGGGAARFSGEGFEVEFKEDDPEGTIQGACTREVDLTYFHIMNRLRKAVLAADQINYINA